MKMRRNVISTRRLILALMLGIGALVFGASTASAHVVTVSCAGTGSGQWTITNSQTTETMTFSAPGASPSSGTIPGGGSATVGFSGTSLTVTATWTDGITEVGYWIGRLHGADNIGADNIHAVH